MGLNRNKILGEPQPPTVSHKGEALDRIASVIREVADSDSLLALLIPILESVGYHTEAKKLYTLEPLICRNRPHPDCLRPIISADRVFGVARETPDCDCHGGEGCSACLSNPQETLIRKEILTALE